MTEGTEIELTWTGRSRQCCIAVEKKYKGRDTQGDDECPLFGATATLFIPPIM